MNLVTGATGHIGNVLIRSLVEQGKKVRAMLMPGEDPHPIQGLGVDLVEADVLDYASVLAAFRGVTHAYHLAGLVTIMPGQHPMLRAVNVLGTRNVLQAARQCDVGKLVYTSSIHALRRVPQGVVIDESIPFDPDLAISDYDRSKAKASLDVLQAAREGLRAVIVCPTGVIGPYDYRRSEMGQLLIDCMDGRPQLYTDGGYDFVDVRDIARGHVLAAEQGTPGETYLLAGEWVPVRRLLDSVAEITGRPFLRLRIPLALARFVSRFSPTYYRLSRCRPRFTPYSLETIRSNAAVSHEKAARALGYAPRALRESLADTIAWFRENREVTERFASALAVR